MSSDQQRADEFASRLGKALRPKNQIIPRRNERLDSLHQMESGRQRRAGNAGRADQPFAIHPKAERRMIRRGEALGRLEDFANEQ